MSQKSRIREALLCGITITQHEASRWYGCDRLSPRMTELKKEGMNIVTDIVKTDSGKYIGKYHLIREEA